MSGKSQEQLLIGHLLKMSLRTCRPGRKAEGLESSPWWAGFGNGPTLLHFIVVRPLPRGSVFIERQHSYKARHWACTADIQALPLGHSFSWPSAFYTAHQISKSFSNDLFLSFLILTMLSSHLTSLKIILLGRLWLDVGI